MTVVLLVEDDPDISELVSVVLSANGHEAVPVTTGEEALEVAPTRAVDLVLLDIRLPGIDGWTVLERLRDDERTAAVPVVIMSAHADGSARLQAEEAGAAGYLVKPFTTADLLDWVTSQARVQTEPDV